MLRLTLVTTAFLAQLGCGKTVDKMALRKPIKQAMMESDLDAACTSARALTALTQSLAKKSPPRRALAVLETTAGICAEQKLWEAELVKERRKRHVEGVADVESVSDAKQLEQRYRAEASARMWRGFQHADAHFGPIGEQCPKLRNDEDEFAFMLGLLAGANAMLYDQSSGGQIGVPTNVVARVGKGAMCLDDDKWWHIPAAITAGWWSMVPGTAPEGVDAWDALERAAAASDATGIRIARALQVVLTANAGRDDEVRHGIASFAAARAAVEPLADYTLLDIYAMRHVLQQSDVMWIRERGSRTARLGELPVEEPKGGDQGLSGSQDPFAEEDPFQAQDPFAEPVTPAEASDTETSQ
jgi:hypothetical protein